MRVRCVFSYRQSVGGGLGTAQVIKKNMEEPDAVSCLVLGTEAGQILILDPSGTAVAHKVSYSVP